MGSFNKKCSVATLNYSGIYLSPFEYYAIDNWQELQRIGRIFEFQLQQEFGNIRTQNLKLGGKTFNKVKQYNRKTFEWQIGKIDKVIHEDRYTPIYTSKDKIKSKKFAGIGTLKKDNGVQQQYIMNQLQFQTTWRNTFQELASGIFSQGKKEIKMIAKQSKPLQRYNCSMFDFLCYKSIILYLYTKLQNDGKRMSYKEDNTHQFQAIARQSLEYSDHRIVELYKDFMAQYFERIDTQKKVCLTIESIFSKRDRPSIITFTEATPAFRKQLQSLQGYFFYGPNDQAKTKQTLILLRQDLPFIPAGYNIDGYHHKLDQFKKQTARQLREFVNAFEIFWIKYFKSINKQKTSKEHEAFTTFMEALRKDFLFWTKDFLVTDFQDKRIIIGAFHLNSKPEINCFEVQLLGLLIYQLVSIRGYRFIFAGDFNSYINLSEKDNVMSLFSFVKSQISKSEIDKLINTVRVYPKHPKIITTKKKRTILQVQYRKVNDLAQKSIDQVITNYPLDYDLSHVCEVKDIGSQAMNNQSFLPHKEHPYDHFLVEAFLNLNQNEG